MGIDSSFNEVGQSSSIFQIVFEVLNLIAPPNSALVIQLTQHQTLINALPSHKSPSFPHFRSPHHHLPVSAATTRANQPPSTFISKNPRTKLR